MTRNSVVVNAWHSRGKIQYLSPSVLQAHDRLKTPLIKTYQRTDSNYIRQEVLRSVVLVGWLVGWFVRSLMCSLVRSFLSAHPAPAAVA